MKQLWNRFWGWYGKNYALTLAVTATLFTLQALHLYWLLTDIILQKLTGHSWFVFPPQGLFIYVLIDYIKIPTHLSLSVIYIYNMRKKFRLTDLVYFIFLQIHWLHIFWITDEVVLQRLTGQTPLTFNTYLAWFAILIDYLELPVMVDQVKKMYSERDLIWKKLAFSVK